MGTLEPLSGRGLAVANPAENGALGSSLDTFLMTSILDIVCLALGGFSEKQEKNSIAYTQLSIAINTAFKYGMVFVTSLKSCMFYIYTKQ